MKRLARLAVVVGMTWMFGCSAQKTSWRVHGFSFISPQMQACADKALRSGPDPADLPLAFVRFKDGCELGDPAACSLLGVMYARGLGIPQSDRKALGFFSRACSAGNTIGCDHLRERAGLPPAPESLAVNP